MIVCICRRVSDRAVAKAIAGGARTIEEIGDATGAGTHCGCCRSAIEAQLAGPVAPCSSPPCAACPRAAADPCRGTGGALELAAADQRAAALARAAA